MMMRSMLSMVFVGVVVLAGAPAALAQDVEVTGGWLKAKGAKMLSKAELESLLPGSVYEDETDQYERRFQNEADGRLDINYRPRIGAGTMNQPFTLSGNWRVSDQGQYCTEYRSRTNEYKSCWYVWMSGSDYYITFGRADQSKGRKAKISK